jgi:Rps23 Pro-64 3,4-dihydroxylase Tpa1-like proline 4-hydroxylase|tara:strand:- start:9 stop:545 length:537 start_codon:yes stop_codon:yes gene_type:complete
VRLEEIFDKQVLFDLESAIFKQALPWALNYSNSKIDSVIGKNHESFALEFPFLKDFKHYDYLLETCNKIYSDQNLKFCEKDSKILIYPSGYDGIIHRDTTEGKDILTTITFLNSEWKKSWGGEILCYSQDCKVVVGGVVPEFGKTFLFNGGMPHRALAPIRLSSLMRAVLVTKEDNYD